ncbi:Autophagy-related protein 18g [Camellia lanceoleosa]|uniref:Autophagy-related protein 18g n=1 Tax=Camellia lanceoleosa TaxID=1840588 RepID=A0ACC0GZT4_9ERIC|nr:Autophagy-related protein 18g [Camellia lanceoleosa]
MFNQQNLCASGPPFTLSVVSRIRSGNNGWRSTVIGATATVTGRTSSLSGAIASTFHNCKGNDLHAGASSLKAKYHLLVFSPSGCMIQYTLRASSGLDSAAVVSGSVSSYDLAPKSDARLLVEAI